MKNYVIPKQFLIGGLACVLLVSLWIGISWNIDSHEPWPSDRESEGNLYRFEDYATSATFVGRPAAPDLSGNPRASVEKDILDEGAAAGPNFAGTYTVIEWNCANEMCANAAIVDARTGALYEFGILSSYGFQYRDDSALFIVNPLVQTGSSTPVTPITNSLTTDYYVFKDGALTLLAKQDTASRERLVCIEQTVTATNPSTGDIRDFGNPCMVPYGWEIQTNPSDGEPIGVPGNTEPVMRGECYVGGCSAQLCSDTPGMASTCEWNESYACYQGQTCERQATGECGWTMTEELSACLQ